MGLIDLVKSLRKSQTQERQKEFDFENMTLMYENEKVADVKMAKDKIDEITFVYNENKFPVGVRKSDIFTLTDALSMWLEYKTIPNGRPNISECLNRFEISSTTALSRKSFYLSLNDNYWLKPQNIDIRWESVNIYANGFSSDIGDILFDPFVNKSRVNFVSPDNTTNGLDAKRWINENGNFYLLKTNYKKEQVAYNEVFAMKVAQKLGLKTAEYSIVEGNIVINNQKMPCVFSKTLNYCKEGETVLPIGYMRILTNNNTKKLIDFIKDNYPKEFKEFQKMLVLDYIIANEDRHADNISIRIDKNGDWHFGTVYDNGNSMYYENDGVRISGDDPRCKFFGHLSNKEVLQEYITYYQDLNFFHMDDFSDIKDIVFDVYGKSNMSQERIRVLSEIVQEKLSFLKQYKERLYEKHTSII